MPSEKQNSMTAARELIAIDPGPHESAMLIWNGDNVTAPQIVPNNLLLAKARASAGNANQNRLMVVEMIACYGMPVGAETFETCLLIGRLQEIWMQADHPFQLVYRREVKMHICGTMKAKDPNIRQALIDRFGIVGTKKNPGRLFGVSSHLWAALGVAVTAMDMQRTKNETP